MFPDDKTFFQIVLEELKTIFIVFIVLSGIIFGLLNGGAFWQNIRYKIILFTPFVSAELREGDILEIEVEAFSQIEAGDLDERPLLVIPRIAVTVPIVTARNESKSAILASLEEGVGLYPNSVNVGVPGRSVILGHSSRATWYRGEYATIFSLLPNMREGDEMIIIYGGKRLVYKVVETLFVSPAETNLYVNKPVEGHVITLITCYPIGSASQRNIVTAELLN